jgi:hypothetical protein
MSRVVTTTCEKLGTAYAVPRRGGFSAKPLSASTPHGQSGLSLIFRPLHLVPRRHSHRYPISGPENTHARRIEIPADAPSRDHRERSK